MRERKMFDIDTNGIISLTRGDSFEAPLFINCGTLLRPLRYDFNDADNQSTKVYFSLMQPNQPFEFGCVRKIYDYTDANEEGDIEIKFEPCDTLNLCPGKYYYEIKMVIDGNENQVNTIIKKTEFRLL